MRFRRVLLALTLLGAARPALACGTCTASIVDSFAPPVRWWLILGFSWFLANGAIRTFTKAPLPAQPGLLGTIGLSLAAAVVAAAAVGPLVVPLLLIPPLAAMVLAFDAKPFPGRLALRIVGGLHLAALAVCLGMMAYILKTRTDGEFIVQWDGAAMAQSRLHQLQKEEPRSLPTYRYLIEHGRPRLIAKAAARIALVGSPEVDGPILEKALQRSANEPELAESLTAALSTLRGRRDTLLHHER